MCWKPHFVHVLEVFPVTSTYIFICFLIWWGDTYYSNVCNEDSKVHLLYLWIEEIHGIFICEVVCTIVRRSDRWFSLVYTVAFLLVFQCRCSLMSFQGIFMLISTHRKFTHYYVFNFPGSILDWSKCLKSSFWCTRLLYCCYSWFTPSADRDIQRCFAYVKCADHLPLAPEIEWTCPN